MSGTPARFLVVGVSGAEPETASPPPGQERTVKAGDAFVLRPGFTGTWEVVETTRKEYVIRL